MFGAISKQEYCRPTFSNPYTELKFRSTVSVLMDVNSCGAVVPARISAIVLDESRGIYYSFPSKSIVATTSIFLHESIGDIDTDTANLPPMNGGDTFYAILTTLAAYLFDGSQFKSSLANLPSVAGF